MQVNKRDMDESLTQLSFDGYGKPSNSKPLKFSLCCHHIFSSSFRKKCQPFVSFW